MIRTELSLRLPNSPGALAAVTRLLSDERVNILAMALEPGGQLRLVVDNLLENAALHGGGRVDVDLAREDGRWLLRVADDGPGIPEAERERLLEPLARGRGTTAQGTGLGLAIVAQQVGLHGGELRLSDSSLGGLAAEVRLPARA